VAPRGSNRKFWKKIKCSGFECEFRIQVEKEVKNKQNEAEGGKRVVKTKKEFIPNYFTTSWIEILVK
jgi:hypothetical protein